VLPTAMHDRLLLVSYQNYSDAQAAVDRLSDERFPVEETSIIGRDLRLVEDVTGRLSYGRAALSGAAGGAWFGLLVGVFLAIFATDATSTIALVLWGVLFGILAGVLFAVAAYAMTGGRRDFVSVSQIVADRYDVLVDARTIDDARRILGMAGGSAPAAPGAASRVPMQRRASTPEGNGSAGADPAEAPPDGDGRRAGLRERLAERAGLRSDR
jgi:hypothetical protein